MSGKAGSSCRVLSLAKKALADMTVWEESGERERKEKKKREEKGGG